MKIGTISSGVERLGVFFLVFCLTISVFCMQSVQMVAAEKIKLSLTMSVYVEAPHKKAFDLLKEAYEKKNPNVEILYYGAPYDEFWDKLMVEIVAGTEADIAQMQIGGTKYATYASLRKGPTGAFVNLDPYIKGTHWEENLVGQKDLVYSGHYIGISNYAWGARAFFYRKSMYEEAGIDPDSIKIMDDFTRAAIKLTKRPERYGFGATLTSHPWVVNEWYTTLARPAGQGLFFPGEKPPYTPERIMVNTPPIIWAAKLWQDWVHKYQITPLGKEKADIRDLFWRKVVATHVDGPWFVGMTREYDPELLKDSSIYATPAVIYKGEVRRQPGDTYAITHLISSNSKHPEEAWKFLEWMTTPEAQRIIGVCGMIPSNKEYSTSPEYKKAEPINSLFVAFLDEYAPTMPDPNIPQFGALDRVMIEAGQEMFIAGADVKETLDEAAEEMRRIMSK